MPTKFSNIKMPRQCSTTLNYPSLHVWFRSCIFNVNFQHSRMCKSGVDWTAVGEKGGRCVPMNYLCFYAAVYIIVCSHYSISFCREPNQASADVFNMADRSS